MSLDASTLKVVVQSDGIADTTKALNDLAAAGAKAEAATSNIGSGAKAAADKQASAAKDAAKAQVDAAQQAASAYNAIIDMMTEKANQYYANQATAAQQELFDGMAMMDKLRAASEGYYADLATKREKDSADTLAKQQQQMDAAQAWYAAQQDLANRMNAAFDKKQSTSLEDAHAAAIIEDKKRAWQALGQAQAEAIKINNQLDAAQKALENDHGKAILEDKARAWKVLGQAQAEANAINAKMDSDAKALDADAKAFVETLRRQADTVGMTSKQLKDYHAQILMAKADQLGVGNEVDGYIKKINSAKGAHEGLSLATAGTARETMVLIHELSTGNINKFFGSLLVEANRMNLVPTVLKGVGTAAESLGVSVLGLSVAFLALGTVAIGGILTWTKSVEALHEMKDAVVLTGGAAGATGDQLYDMAQKIGAATGEFGKSREAVLSLANTGRFSADQINMIAEAAVGLEKFGGQSIEKTTAMFEKLAAEPLRANVKGFHGVSDAAMQLDQQLHFLEPSVLAQIIHFENINEAAKGSAVVIKALADEEKNRAEELKDNLTPLGALLVDIEEKASRMWNALFNKGTNDEQLKGLKAALEEVKAHPIWSAINDGLYASDIEKQITDLQNKIRKEDAAAKQKAYQDDLNKEDNLAMIRIRNIHTRAKSEEAAEAEIAKVKADYARERAKASRDPKFAKESGDMFSAANEAADIAYINRTRNNHPKAPKSDGLSSLNEHLAEINGKFEIDKRYYDNQIKFIDDLYNKHLISDSAYDAAKKAMLENEAKLEENSLNDQLDLAKNFHSADTKLMEQAATKKADIQKRLDKFIADNAAKQDRAATDPAARAKKEQDDLDKQAAQFVKQTADQTASIQAKIDAYNAMPASAKAAGVTEKQMQDEITQSIIDRKQATLDSIKGTDTASTNERIRLTQEIAALKDKTAAQKAWEDIQAKNNAALNRSSALTKIATEQVKVWKDAGNEIEKALTNAFGNAGQAAGKMFKAFADNQASQIDLANQIRVVKEKEGLTDAERVSQIGDLQKKSAQDQINSYGQMADAASGFFEKGSTGYQAMHKMSEIFYIAETAMALASIPAKLAAGAATMFAQSGWGAFAGVAAMTALVASFGVAVSGGGKGPITAENQQKIQGTGTVLGSPTITDGIEVKLVGAKSDSIANSLKIAEKNSGLGLVVQNDMLTALQKLNDSIGSFATLIVRDYDVTNPNVGPLNTNNGGMTNVLETFAGGVVGFAITKLIPGLNNIVGKIATAIFGGKQTIDDSGITLGSQSLGSIAANGVNAQSYANITTSGGLFHGDDHDHQVKSLGSDANNQIDLVIKNMSDTIQTAAKSLGMSGDAFTQRLNSFVVNIGNISLKGMTGDQIQQTLQNVFSKLGDQMATFAFGDLQKYQKVGEGLMETVVRVANDLQQVNDVFTVLGKTIPQGLAGIAQAESLITSFGSVDNLTKGIQAYVGAIYTDQEKLAYITKDVTSAMDGLNLSSVKTKEQFKAVVDGLDLTSQAGQDLLAKLLAIAPEFGQMVDGADKAATDARSALTDAYNKESQAIKDTQSKMQSFVTTLKQLASSSLLGDLSPLTPEQKYLEAKSQFETVVAKAQSGDETAQGQFENAYNAFLSASKVANASGDQFQKDFAEAQKTTQDATEWAQKQVDVAQATLDALNKQVAGMVDVTDGLTTVTQAINNLVSALGADGQTQATTNTQNAIESMFESILKRQASSYEMSTWVNAINSGESMSDLATALSNGTPTQVRTTPVQAHTFAQTTTNADLVAAMNDMKDSITTAVTDSGKDTVAAVQSLVGPLYDSGAATADATATGVAEAVQSSKVGTRYAIAQR